MDRDGDGDVGFIHDRGESMRSSPTSGMDTNPLSTKVAVMAMSPMPVLKSSNGEYPFFGSGWDPLISMSQGGDFGGSLLVSPSEFGHPYSAIMENSRVNNSTSQLLQYPISSSNLLGLVPGFSSFGNRNFPEMIGSSGLSEVGQAAYASSPQDYPQMQNKERSVVKTPPTSGHSQEEYPMAEDGRAGGVSPNEKGRKRVVDSSSPFNHIKNFEGEQYKDHSGESSGFEEAKGDKKQKIEQTPVTNLHRKQSAKQTKANPKTGEAPEGNYVHMRARRGQATNSHSLAERVRREKISERMKMLQELVPGCNKITGKAVMLDEIINYVQSLQQQVEFLSMKLATVNPELNIDLEQILSKDLLHLQGDSSAILGSSGMHSMQSHPHGTIQGNMPSIPNIVSQFHHMPQNLWDNDLQSLLQMGFGSSMAVENPGANGRPRPEI